MLILSSSRRIEASCSSANNWADEVLSQYQAQLLENPADTLTCYFDAKNMTETKKINTKKENIIEALTAFDKTWSGATTRLPGTQKAETRETTKKAK